MRNDPHDPNFMQELVAWEDEQIRKAAKLQRHLDKIRELQKQEIHANPGI